MRKGVRLLAVSLVGLLCATSALAQQRGLTDGQIRSAEVEVPRLVEQLELEPGATVADVGAGFGAWTVRFAGWTGEAGHVYATEIGDRQLAFLRETAEQDRLANVTVIEGAVDDTNLPDACCDAILARDAFHHFTEPAAMIESLAAALRPGGRLAIIDFPPLENSSVPEGVPADRGGHGVPPEVVEREIGAVLPHESTTLEWSSRGPGRSLFLVVFRKP